MDEGSGPDLCPAVSHAIPRCTPAGNCEVAGCQDGYYDIDRSFNNGCECHMGAGENAGGATCNTAIDKGNVADTGEVINISGRVMPGSDADWYSFRAIDTPDQSCDRFHVDVRFQSNPSNALTFDVFKDSCVAGGNVCTAGHNYAFATDFYDKKKKLGECPCSTHVATVQNTNCGSAEDDEGDTSKCGAFPTYAEPKKNFCSDQSSTFYVKVYLKPGFSGVLPCTDYKIKVTNGVYTTQ